MSSLFSSFDPQVWGISWNWLVCFLPTFVLLPGFFLSSNYSSMCESFFVKQILSDFRSALGEVSNPGISGLILGLFIYLMLGNLLGLLPYVFTVASHLVYTLTLGLSLWVGQMVISIMKQPKYVLAHLIPNGTPGALLLFMFFIELLSTCIRPLTLSVRLMANMTAGHLLFSLLSVGLSVDVTNVSVYGILVVFMFLMVLEISVAMIQAYVFSLLSCLYISEQITLNLEN